MAGSNLAPHLQEKGMNSNCHSQKGHQRAPFLLNEHLGLRTVCSRSGRHTALGMGLHLYGLFLRKPQVGFMLYLSSVLEQ